MKTRLLMLTTMFAGLLLAACSGNVAVPPNVAPTLAAGAQSAQQTVQAAAPAIVAGAQQTVQAVAPTIVAQATNLAPTISAVQTSAAPTLSALATQLAPTISAAATTAAPAAGAAPSGNPGDIILNAEKLRITKSTRVTIVTTTSDNSSPQTTMTIEYQPPDRLHTVGLDGSETIVIKGQGTWINRGGKWAKSPVDMSDVMMSSYSEAGLQELEKSMQMTPAKFVGPDLVDGQPMWVYQYTTTIDIGTGSPVTSQDKLWIGAVDGLPHKAESDTPSLTKKGVTTHAVITYQYDPSINIQAPM